MKNIQRDVLDYITPDIRKEMERIWFTADLHYAHRNIVDHCNRPVSKDEMNEWIVRDVINKYVKNNDDLYILGDLTMIKKTEAEKFIDRLNGNKWLIIGNHDKNLHKSNRFIQITQRKNFRFKRGNLDIIIVLDHYPLISWEKRIHGAWHLYGHVHGRNIGLGRSHDIGIDNRDNMYRPRNLYEICLIMADKPQYSDIDKMLSTENMGD